MVAKSVAELAAELIAELTEKTAQMGNHGDCAHDRVPVQHTTAPEGSHHWHYACEGARRANNVTSAGKQRIMMNLSGILRALLTARKGTSSANVCFQVLSLMCCSLYTAREVSDRLFR